jgi:hypothetical protein
MFSLVVLKLLSISVKREPVDLDPHELNADPKQCYHPAVLL